MVAVGIGEVAAGHIVISGVMKKFAVLLLAAIVTTAGLSQLTLVS